MKDKQFREVDRWNTYLLFSCILGLADKVEKQLKSFDPSVFNRYNTFYYSNYFVNHSIRIQMSRNLYSRSGGSSSGFSGGGGGGTR